MKMFLMLTLALFVGAASVGCDQKAGKKVETTVKTPEGETKMTEEVTVEKSGEHKDHTHSTGTPGDPTLTPPSDSPKPQ